ncbi:zinc finger, CCHC-type containing protein [Tanacetum coccineum]
MYVCPCFALTSNASHARFASYSPKLVLSKYWFSFDIVIERWLCSHNTNNYGTSGSILLAGKNERRNLLVRISQTGIAILGLFSVVNLEQEVAYLMLLSMSPDLHRTFEKYNAYDMMKELKTMFEEQAKQELFETVKAFHACKQEDGQLVSSYLLKMKSHLDTFECLGYAMPKELGVSLILYSLNKDYDQFVQNYNMHSMRKTLAELHVMLKLHEKGILKKAETPVVLAIREGKIHNNRKKPQGAKGKAKGKNKLAYAPNTKILPSSKRDNLAKDSICHHCKEVGHWRRNCPSYHAELKKRKNASEAGTSGIFTIELYAFPNNTWVYDTGCGTHICNTSQGLKGSRKLKHGALGLYMGNRMRATVEAIRSFDLIFSSGLIIVLDNCHFAPTVTRDVVSISHLVKNGYIHTFTNYGISVSKDIVFYFNAIPRMEVDATVVMKGLLHYSSSLQMITAPPWFLFTDETLNMSVFAKTFKVFQNEVENQLGKKIKAIRSDREGEYLTRILNMVPTKKVDRTSYEIWHGKALKLSYLRVWGCEVLVKQDTPDKLDSRSIKCIFVGYPKETMEASGSHGLLEMSRSDKGLEIIQEEDIQPSKNTSKEHNEVAPIKYELEDLDEPPNYKAALVDPESDK